MDNPGSLVAERYELHEQIGVGGAGAVFRAHDRVLGRDVAVKRLRAGTDADARARLRIEAQLCGALAHPGIARVHDYGEEGEGRAATPYLVMEYVDGQSLREIVREGGPLPADRVMSLVAQVADALEVAHAAGIIHRDVKPGNILIRRDGRATLVDFGIARGLDLEPLTLTGTLVGTVDYISPEQADGQGATRLSDLYSLGMVAYECLTGIRPLRRDSQVATLLAHLNEDVPRLPDSVPAPVREVVHRLTARDPRRRPADAATAARLARAAIAALDASDASDASDAAALTASLTPVRSRRRRWAVLAPLAAAAACVAYLPGAPSGPSASVASATADVASAPASVRVPVRRLLGSSYAEAGRILSAAGLVARLAGGGAAPAGGVVTSVWPRGLVAPGSAVALTVATPAPSPSAAPLTAATGTGPRTTRAPAPQRAAKKPAPSHAAKDTAKAHGKSNGHGKGKGHGG